MLNLDQLGQWAPEVPQYYKPLGATIEIYYYDQGEHISVFYASMLFDTFEDRWAFLSGMRDQYKNMHQLKFKIDGLHGTLV